MVSDEYQMRAACIMRDAASEMTKAVSDVQESVRQFQFLLADGYGGNGLALLEELRALAAKPSAAPLGASCGVTDELRGEPAAPSSEAQAWIPVGERLPEPDTWVLVHNGKWTGVGMHCALDHSYGSMEESERWQDERREFIEHLGPKVTHWMPLPAAPAKVEQQENGGEAAK